MYSSELALVIAHGFWFEADYAENLTQGIYFNVSMQVQKTTK